MEARSTLKGRATNVQGPKETGEFPILCETCLGDNPYVRMARAANGTLCKICDRPTTQFRWKAGTTGRFKVTVTCQACSNLKNTCQCCILDLQYGLPVEVRDTVLAQALAAARGTGPAGALPAGPGGSTAIVMSNKNLEYARSRAIAAGGAGTDDGTGSMSSYADLAALVPEAHEKLLRMGKARATYARNDAKICSFFVRGECTRGASCPYRHVMPRDKDDPLAAQDYKERFYGSSDPVAQRLLARMQQNDAARAERFQEDDAEMGADPTAMTIWVGNLPLLPGIDAATHTAGPALAIDEAGLRQALQKHGHIVRVTVLNSARSRCAFVEYSTHEAAVAAVADARARGLVLGGTAAFVRWSKPKGDEEGGSRRRGPKLFGEEEGPSAPPSRRPAASTTWYGGGSQEGGGVGSLSAPMPEGADVAAMYAQFLAAAMGSAPAAPAAAAPAPAAKKDGGGLVAYSDEEEEEEEEGEAGESKAAAADEDSKAPSAEPSAAAPPQDEGAPAADAAPDAEASHDASAVHTGVAAGATDGPAPPPAVAEGAADWAAAFAAQTAAAAGAYPFPGYPYPYPYPVPPPGYPPMMMPPPPHAGAPGAYPYPYPPPPYMPFPPGPIGGGGRGGEQGAGRGGPIRGRDAEGGRHHHGGRGGRGGGGRGGGGHRHATSAHDPLLYPSMNPGRYGGGGGAR